MFTVMLLLFRCCNGCLLFFRCCNWCVVWLYCYLGVATDVYCEFYVASMGSINTDNMVSFVEVFAYWKLPPSLIWAKSWPCFFLKSLSWKLISHCTTKIIPLQYLAKSPMSTMSRMYSNLHLYRKYFGDTCQLRLALFFFFFCSYSTVLALHNL